MSDPRAPKDCRLFLDCSANFCPLDPDFKSKVWCPEENDHDEICRNPEFVGLQYMKTQRRIGKAARRKNVERDDYFSFSMLDGNTTVRGAIRGIPCDPPDTIKDNEKWCSDREGRWITFHPGKKQLSNDEIEKRRLRMISIRKERSSVHFLEIVNTKSAIAHPDAQSLLKPIENGGSEK